MDQVILLKFKVHGVYINNNQENSLTDKTDGMLLRMRKCCRCNGLIV